MLLKSTYIYSYGGRLTVVGLPRKIGNGNKLEVGHRQAYRSTSRLILLLTSILETKECNRPILLKST